jgi:hypothetical protein
MDAAERKAAAEVQYAKSALNDRRQAARKVCSDVFTDGASVSDDVDLGAAAIDAAIESATRVRITPEIEDAFMSELGRLGGSIDVGHPEACIAAAFAAAGFEVER